MKKNKERLNKGTNKIKNTLVKKGTKKHVEDEEETPERNEEVERDEGQSTTQDTGDSRVINFSMGLEGNSVETADKDGSSMGNQEKLSHRQRSKT